MKRTLREAQINAWIKFFKLPYYMDDIKTYAFKPISNEKQDLHVISIAERIRKGGETVLNPHRTDFYLLIYVTSGKSSHMVDFEDIQLNKNSIIIIQPNGR